MLESVYSVQLVVRGCPSSQGNLANRPIPMAIDEKLQSLVYFLTDHLFAAIEAGENISAATFSQSETKGDLVGSDILAELENLRGFINDLSDWEEELVTKVLQARQWSGYLKEYDPFFKPIIDLFSSATHPLTDIAAQIRDHHDRHFEGGDHPDWYIQSRALNVKQSKQGQILSLSTGDIYLIGGHVRLGQLLEMSETYLETLEARFPQLWLPAEEAMLDNTNSDFDLSLDAHQRTDEPL